MDSNGSVRWGQVREADTLFFGLCIHFIHLLTSDHSEQLEKVAGKWEIPEEWCQPQIKRFHQTLRSH